MERFFCIQHEERSVPGISVFFFHQEQPTEHFHIHIQFSQDSPHHIPDNNWIQEVLFCFWKGSRLSWETPWHRIVLMLWLCSPWSRNSSETSLTLIRRSSKALPLKRQEEQSFCTGSQKKKMFSVCFIPRLVFMHSCYQFNENNIFKLWNGKN